MTTTKGATTVKNFLLSLLLIPALSGATDFTVTKCPVLPNCVFSAAAGAATFSDTFTITLGNWQEYYGVYEYTSSLDVTVKGSHGISGCAGRGCHGLPYDVEVASASVDGIPLVWTGTIWKLTISLAPGKHVIAVTGSATGPYNYGTVTGTVEGVQYTLIPNPPCTGDCGDD